MESVSLSQKIPILVSNRFQYLICRNTLISFNATSVVHYFVLTLQNERSQGRCGPTKIPLSIARKPFNSEQKKELTENMSKESSSKGLLDAIRTPEITIAF